MKLLATDAREAEAMRASTLAQPLRWLEGVEIVEGDAAGAARSLVRGEADLAIVYGAAAGSLIDDARRPCRIERAVSWDKVYALWLSSEARWTQDPRFRRWIASIIDREAMLRFVFDGRGAPAARLTRGDAPGLDRGAPAQRPFSGSSAPGLQLLFDSGDAHAAAIAARLKAAFELEGLKISLDGRPREHLEEARASGHAQIELLAHHPSEGDSVRSLQATLMSLGEGARPALELLRGAAGLPDGEGRRRAAGHAEDVLLVEHRLVPLVRLHAWLATAHGLTGVRAGAYGMLDLERARWAR